MTTSDWREDAICAQIGPNDDLWFPKGESSAGKQICATCPALHRCLTDALLTPSADDYGIRGGTTAAERRKLRRKVAA